MILLLIQVMQLYLKMIYSCSSEAGCIGKPPVVDLNIYYALLGIHGKAPNHFSQTRLP